MRSKHARRYARKNGSTASKTKKKKKTWKFPPGRPPGVPYTKNPPPLTDLGHFILPGFAGYGATRLLGRITHVQVAKRWPKFGKHAAVLTSLGSFLAAWLVAHRVKAVAKYHTPIVVGAGIATLQTAIQTYVPWLGWMVADVKESDAALPAGTPATTNAPVASAGHSVFDEADQAEDEWATYNDAFDKGRYAAPASSAPAETPAAAQADQAMDDMLSELGLEEELGAGIFAN
jgi:hypothetical protein